MTAPALHRNTTVLWWLAAILPLGILYRLPYFQMSKYELLRIAGDSSWWWIIQRWFERDGTGFNTFIIENRIKFRLPTDIFWQEHIVALSRELNIDLMDSNLVVTSLLLLACASFVFLAARRYLQHPLWCFLFTICFMLTTYAGFLRYPVFVPKMIGFTLFPAILMLSLDMVEKNSGYLKNLLLFGLLMCTYFVSFSYTAPALCAATVLTGLYIRYRKADIGPFLLRQTAFWLAAITLGITVMLILKGGGTALRPPPLEVTETIYKKHQFSMQKLQDYFQVHLFSILAVSVGALLVFRFAPGHHVLRTRFIFSAIIFIVLLGVGVISHALASQVDFFRSTWYWRSSYYSYLPATLCLFIGLAAIPDSLFEQASKVTTLRMGTVLLFALAFVYAQTGYFNKPEQFWFGLAFQPRYPALASSNPDDDLRTLIGFARSLPQDSLILLPPIKTQKSDIDIFEAESGVPVTLSRNERMHLIYETPHTYPYASDVNRYEKITDLPDAEMRATALIQFAGQKNASHILLRADGGVEISSPNLYEVFNNRGWVLYALENPDRA